MMLADPEDVEPHLIGDRDLLHEIGEPLLRRDDRAVSQRRGLDERIDPEFHD